MSSDPETLQRILEAALLAAARPLDLDELLALFPEQERPDRAALRAALAALREQYASHAMELRVLLRAWKRFGNDDALRMARLTLDRMAMGGMYDHLGGGWISRPGAPRPVHASRARP